MGNFLIKEASKYLGFYLGPAANSLQWRAALAKFQTRVNKIYNSKAGISVAAYVYNSRAVPVTSYVAQLCPLPPSARHLERVALHRITHMATNAIPTRDFSTSIKVGGPLSDP